MDEDYNFANKKFKILSITKKFTYVTHSNAIKIHVTEQQQLSLNLFVLISQLLPQMVSPKLSLVSRISALMSYHLDETQNLNLLPLTSLWYIVNDFGPVTWKLNIVLHRVNPTLLSLTKAIFQLWFPVSKTSFGLTKTLKFS